MNSSFVIAALVTVLLATGCASEMASAPGDTSATEQAPVAYHDSTGIAFGSSDALAALQSIEEQATKTPRVSVHASPDSEVSAPTLASGDLGGSPASTLSAGGTSCSVSGCSASPTGCSVTCTGSYAVCYCRGAAFGGGAICKCGAAAAGSGAN